MMIILCFILLDFWYQTDWSGGGGQGEWSDTTKFFNKQRICYSRTPGSFMLDAPNGWKKTGEQAGANNIWALLETQDSVIYSCGDSAALKGFVFKSTDLGNTWLNTNIPTCNWVHDLLQYHTGTIYAATDQGVFKYATSWTDAGLSVSVNALIETSDSILYAGTWDGEIYKSTDGSSWTPVTVNNAVRIWDIIEVNDTLYAAGTRRIHSNEFAGVFKSVDGSIFDTTCFPHIDKTVYAILLAQDSKIYAGTGPDSGKVFKTQDGANTWDTTQNLGYANSVYSLLQTDYSTIYAGTGTLAGYLYKSNNGGQTWTSEQIDATVSNIYSLLQTANSFLYAGTNKGMGSTTGVWKAGYFSSGWLKSSSYEADSSNNVNYDSVFWDVELNGGSVEVWLRTNTQPDMWGMDSFQVMNQGDTIPDAFDNKGYIQYQIKLYSPTPDSTPIFKHIELYYTPYIGVEEEPAADFSLRIYPNPFTQKTTIVYKLISRQADKGRHQEGSTNLSTYQPINLSIYDLSGRVVRTFNHLTIQPFNQIIWDGGDNEGKIVKSGIYFIRFRAGEYKKTKKLILLK